MKSPKRRFNNYLAVLLLLAWVPGCASPEERELKKQKAVIRLFVEAEYTTGQATQVVPVYRAAPVPVRVSRQPFLDSASLTEASVIDVVGGFALKLQFDYHGTLTLDTASTSYKGSRMIVYAEFPEPRWLAAPRMTTRMTEGVLIFTPDATREEAERIANGLNNEAVRMGNKAKPGAARPKYLAPW